MPILAVETTGDHDGLAHGAERQGGFCLAGEPASVFIARVADECDGRVPGGTIRIVGQFIVDSPFGVELELGQSDGVHRGDR
jgi:hypothetical protein